MGSTSLSITAVDPDVLDISRFGLVEDVRDIRPEHQFPVIGFPGHFAAPEQLRAGAGPDDPSVETAATIPHGGASIRGTSYTLFGRKDQVEWVGARQGPLATHSGCWREGRSSTHCRPSSLSLVRQLRPYKSFSAVTACPEGAIHAASKANDDEWVWLGSLSRTMSTGP